MTNSTDDHLTLASLHPDIIRMIIRMNTGECMEGARIVSIVWNKLIGDFLKRLPPVETVFLFYRSANNRLNIAITIEAVHLRQFKNIFPKDWIVKEEVTGWRHLPSTLETLNRLFYIRELDHPSTILFLSRLFQSTNQIDFFSFDGFDEKSLTTIRKTMRNVNIQYLKICNTKFDIDTRKNIREMIRLHQVYHLIVENSTIYRDELCEIFNIIPKSTPNITVVYTKNGMQPQEFHDYCDSLGEFLVEKKGKALVKFVCSERLVCEKAEPFLMFMRMFFHYDMF